MDPMPAAPAIVIVTPNESLIDATREFSQRYGADYSIHGVGSLAAALETAQELIADEVPLAMFGVATDLDDATVEQAMAELHELSPQARRVALVTTQFAPHTLDRLNEAQQEASSTPVWACPADPATRSFTLPSPNCCPSGVGPRPPRSCRSSRCAPPPTPPD